MDLDIGVTISLRCDHCNTSLDGSVEYNAYKRGEITVSVQPCSHCLAERADEFYEKGKEEGAKETEEAFTKEAEEQTPNFGL